MANEKRSLDGSSKTTEKIIVMLKLSYIINNLFYITTKTKKQQRERKKNLNPKKQELRLFIPPWVSGSTKSIFFAADVFIHIIYVYTYILLRKVQPHKRDRIHEDTRENRTTKIFLLLRQIDDIPIGLAQLFHSAFLFAKHTQIAIDYISICTQFNNPKRRSFALRQRHFVFKTV
jgi:hypothetical protein